MTPFYDHLNPGPVDMATHVGELRRPGIEGFPRMAGSVILAGPHRERGREGALEFYGDDSSWQQELRGEDLEALTCWLMKFLGWTATDRFGEPVKMLPSAFITPKPDLDKS